MLAGDKLASAI